ncbi:MAG: hypothetical protein HY318_11920 [Armatimonadetes bacterium]|nr:hypothetical protein [Armatimonadota bacterium]
MVPGMKTPALLALSLWGLTFPPVLGASPYALRVTDSGIALDRKATGKDLSVIKSLRYEANFTDGPAFRTAGLPLALPSPQVGEGANPQGSRGEGKALHVEFALDGPAAKDAVVAADIEQRPSHVRMKWMIRYTGPKKPFNGWTTGLRIEYAQPVKEARTATVTKFVRPTGDKPYEVKGDTPYRDTECQLREVLLKDTRLIFVTAAYDPDWIYGNNLQRTGFMAGGIPDGASSETVYEFSLFVLSPRDKGIADLGARADLAAQAAGRPISLCVTTDHLGNLFAPGETIRFRLRLKNVTGEPRQGSLDLKVWDYYGRRLTGRVENLRLSPAEERTVPVAVPKAQRGMLFLDATLRVGTSTWFDRTTFGILPQRTLSSPKPESVFGLAGLIASPEVYPDQQPLEDVLKLAQRIGVRWLRMSPYPLKSDPNEDDERRCRERVALVSKYGMSFHAQLGSEVPKPAELEEFKKKLRATLLRFKWVTPYIEIGNELNYSATGPEYVEKMLRHVHEVAREVFPECKVMTMGLGGVGKEWLDAFVAAGGMKYADMLSVHPGSHPRAPEFWEGWRGWVFRSQMLDALEAAKNAGGKEVWITEVYAPTAPDRTALDVRTSADYLVRTYVASLALGVRVTEWYQFQDGVWFGQRQKPDDQEYNFGIVHTDLTPKPGYVAYGAMTEQLEGAGYEGRLDLGAEDLYGVRFKLNGKHLDVLWSYREKHETDLPWWPTEKYEKDSRKPGEPWVARWRQPVSVELPAAGQVVVTDLMGNGQTLTAKGGKVVLPLTGSPVYLQGLGDLKTRRNLW